MSYFVAYLNGKMRQNLVSKLKQLVSLTCFFVAHQNSLSSFYMKRPALTFNSISKNGGCLTIFEAQSFDLFSAR